MYTRFSTQQLASLEAARRRRDRGVGSLWAQEDRKAPMSDVPEGPLAALREQSRKGVQYLLNYMLANAEQYLLGLAGKAPSKGEQANIYEAMRELRLKRRALEEKYAAAVMGGLDDFAANPAPPPPAPKMPTEPAPLSLQGGALGLMHEQRLEESIMVENVASRARIDHRESLLALGRHVSAQTGQRRVDIDALPVGPLALTRHFMKACNDIEVSPQSRLIFVKVYSRFIIEELGPFYAQCLAALPAENDDAAEQARAAGIEAMAPMDLPTGERYDDRSRAGPLQQQAEIAWDNSRTPLLTAPGKAMAMPRNLLEEILLRLQQQLLDRKKPLANLNPKAGILPFEIFELINGELEEMGQTKPLALALDVIETVNLVRLLFDHALREQKVPQPVRRLVRLLQIPVLRAALKDPEVLTGADHPVRALFREIGTASIGCAPQGDPAGDAFFRLLQSLVGRIIGGFGTDLDIFPICLQELRAYLLTEQGRARLLERHTLTAEVGRSEREAAREAVAKIVAGAVGNTPLPRALTDFLRGSWSDALFVIRLQDGAESTAWGTGVETTGKLVALVARGDAGGFGDLAVHLRDGLRRLGLEAAAAVAQVSALEQAVIAGATAGADDAPVAPPNPVRARPAASPEYLQLVDKLAPDTWIEFRLPGHPPARARLLTMFQKTGEFLFVNREGAKAGDWKRDDLAAAMQFGEAVILTGPTAPSGPSAGGRWGRR
jgi:hypothetical protein